MRLRYSLLSFALCLIYWHPSYASERLLASDGNKADIYIRSNYSCAEEAAINIRSSSAGYYDQAAEILQRKIAATVSGILSFECPQISTIYLKGYAENTLVFQGDAKKKERWAIQTEPAPLERIALFISLQEPNFTLLGSLYDQLKPYKNVEGILTSYQFDTYEKQIHRVMSVVDGDTEAFQDYLKQSNGIESFDEALSHYTDILSLIEHYSPDQYPDYKKAYDDVVSDLKNEFWAARVDTLLSDDIPVSQVILKAKDLALSSNSEDFQKYVDSYLSNWIKEEEDFIASYITESPLYEIEWSSEFLTGFPLQYPTGQFPLLSAQLEETANNLPPLINERLSSLEQLAVDTIQESGSSESEIEEILETGFSLASEFDEAGFADIGQNLLSATVNYINKTLDSDFDNFKTELKSIDLDAENTSALQQQLLVYQELSANFTSYAPYVEAIQSVLNSSKDSICANILEDAGAWSRDGSKNIVFSGEPKNLTDFACELYENGHTITELSWIWWAPQTYFLTIRDAEGLESRFELEGDKLVFAENLSIVKRLSDESSDSEEISRENWEKYIAKLILPPPSGRPDENGVRECDRLAADPFDPNKRAQGIDFSSDKFGEGEDDFENFDRAIDACIAAVEDDSSDIVQLYQLGRLFWYSGEPDTAKEYIDEAAETYPPAKYYQAQILLATSEEQNDFVDALDWLEEAGKAGYTRAYDMIKELNPDGIDIYKEIPAPTGKEIIETFAETRKSVSVFGITSYASITGVEVKDCFQTSATDFACEYKKELRCGMSGGGLLGNIMSAAMQKDCDSAYAEFDNFRKLPSGKWTKLPSDI
ncbi:MAG: tetratricopeptide repeat protein [Neptuniibacter sp.]